MPGDPLAICNFLSENACHVDKNIDNTEFRDIITPEMNNILGGDCKTLPEADMSMTAGNIPLDVTRAASGEEVWDIGDQGLASCFNLEARPDVEALEPDGDLQKIAVINHIKRSCKMNNIAMLGNPRRIYNKVANKFGIKRKNNSVIHNFKLASYSTDESRKRYVFPSVENEAKDDDMCLEDTRTIIEVFEDVLSIILERYKPEDIEWLSKVTGYNVSIPQVTKEGLYMPQELLKMYVNEYKNMHGIKNINKALREHLEKELAADAGPTEYRDPEVAQEQPAIDKEVEGFVSFINGHSYVLTSASQKRSFRKLRTRLKYNRKTNKKSRAFMTFMKTKYYDVINCKWTSPEITKEDFPLVCLVRSLGRPLFFLKGKAKSTSGDLASIALLMDTGCTHDILPEKYLKAKNLAIKRNGGKSRIKMYTAGAEVEDCVTGEAEMVVYVIGKNGEKYSCNVNFLVVNDKMTLTYPILGQPWHAYVDHSVEPGTDRKVHTAGFRNEAGKLVRVSVPWSTKASTQECNSVECAEPLTEEKGSIDMGKALPCSSEESEEVECIAKEMVGSILLVYGNTPASEVFKSLGGDSREIKLEVRDDLDELVFNKMDLLSQFNDTLKPKKGSEPSKDIKKKYLGEMKKVLERHPSAVSTEGRVTGNFKHWEYFPDVIPGKTATQKNRHTDLSKYPAAVKKMDDLEKEGIIQISDSQSTEFVHNILIQHKRQNDQVGRGWTKADQAIHSRLNKLNESNVKIRILNDLTTFNRCLRHIPTISLPKESEIRNFIRNKFITLIDLKNMFYSIRVSPKAYHYFNFYHKKTIYSITRLSQGLAASPYVAVEALRRALNDDEWQITRSEKRDKFELLYLHYSSYEQLNISFIDDICIGSFILCKCKGNRCELGIECPTFDMDKSCQLHIEGFEAVVMAIERSGFLIEESKVEMFTQSDFVFLGTRYDALSNKYGVAMDRAKSILEFRVPRSVPELGSRLSAVFWSAPTIPFVKKLALPLIKVLYQNHFQWGRREMHAFNNMKLAVALSVSILNIFNENRYGVLVSDSSKFCASYTFYQVDEQGRLLLVATDTRVLTGAECRKVAVYRELLCLTYGLEQIEHFIMASKKTILVIADAQSILYLKNAQPWDGALGKVALYVSRFPNLMYTFVPGRFMGLCDVLSRQFTDAFLTKTDAPLSKIMSELVPPVPDNIRKHTYMMSAEELSRYLTSKGAKTRLDLWDRGESCRQKEIRARDIQEVITEAQPLQHLMNYLKDPYNISKLNAPAVKDLFKTLSGASKTKIEMFLKDTQLGYLRDILKNIDYKSDWKMVFEPITPKQGKRVIGWTPDQEAPGASKSSKQKVAALTPTPEHRDGSARPSEGSNSVTEQLTLPALTSDKQDAEEATTNMVTTRLAKKKESECPTDKLHSIEIGENSSGCIHQKVLSKSVVLTKKCWEDFCNKLSFWDEFVEAIRGMAKLLSKQPQYNSISQKILNYTSIKCLVAKLAVVRDLCAILSNTQLLSTTLKSNLADTCVVMYSDESPDWQLVEKKGRLVMVLSRDVTLEPFDYVQLAGHMIVLNNDIEVDQVYKKGKVKLYFDCINAHVVLCQSIGLYSTEVVPVMLSKGEELFEVSVRKVQESTIIFAKIPKSKSDMFLSCLSHLVMSKESCRLTEIMTDYFGEVNQAICRNDETIGDTEFSNVATVLAGEVIEEDEDSDSDNDDEAHDGIDFPDQENEDPEPDAQAPEPETEIEEETGTNIRVEKNKLNYHGRMELSSLLFNHRMRQKRKFISKLDLISLQNSDAFLQKIRKDLEDKSVDRTGEGEQLFMIENKILYRNSHIKKLGVTFKTICIPRFLMKNVVINLHQAYDMHYSSDDLYTLLRTSVYCYDLYELIKQVRLSCPTCMYSHPAAKRKVRGNKLLWRRFNKGSNFVAYTDLCFLPVASQTKQNACLCYMDSVSQYFIAIPLKGKMEDEIIKALKSIYLVLPTPGVLASDLGSEYLSGKVRKFLNEMEIEQYFGITKDSQSLIEGAIKIFKTTLNAFLHKSNLDPCDWMKVLIPTVRAVNERPPGKFGLLSRRELFFNPMQYTSSLVKSLCQDEGMDSLPKFHITHLKNKESEELRLIKKKGLVNPRLHKGKVVRTEVARVDQESTPSDGTNIWYEPGEKKKKPGNKQLKSSTGSFLKILKVLSGGNAAVAKDLLNGAKNRYHVGELRDISFYPFPNKNINLHMLRKYIPDKHSAPWAKRVSCTQQPLVFAVTDQSEAGAASSAGHGQSEASKSCISTSASRSILKVKGEKIVQPLNAELTHSDNGISQYNAYERAFDLCSFLNKTDKCQPAPANWMVHLLNQPPNFGTNLACHRSFPAGARCQHTRRVTFSQDSVSRVQPDRPCDHTGLVALCNVYCVSSRELVMHCCPECLVKRVRDDQVE